jgi:uncharacterized membrane protein YagU involved in acid resistance
MKYILITLIAGIAATTLRVLFLEIISKFRKVHVDMIQAIGTLYHGSFHHAIRRGLVVHYIFGIVSAFIYLLLLAVFSPGSVAASAAFGGLIGFFHGCVVSFTLTVIVDEDHPLPQFRKYGYEVVFYYWIAQILYGVVLGAIVGTVHPKLY